MITFKGIWDGLRDALGGFSDGPASPLADGYGPEWGIYYTDSAAYRPGLANATFVACITQLTQGVASGELQVTLDGEVVDDHPLLELWTPELIGPLVQRLYATLSGRSFVLKERAAGMVGMLTPLHADLVLKGGAYHNPQTNEVYSRKDVIPMRLHPAPWRALAYIIGTDLEYTQWARQLVHNNATPGFLVSPKEGTFTSDDQLQLQRNFAQWRRNRGGPVAAPVQADIHEFGIDPQRLGAAAVQLALRSEICSACNVPSPLIGLEPATYANYNTARKVFFEGTVPYLCDLIARAFEEFLLPDFGGDLGSGWEVRFDFSQHPAIQEDIRLIDRQLQSEVIAGLRTVNEWREIKKLPPLVAATPEPPPEAPEPREAEDTPTPPRPSPGPDEARRRFNRPGR